MEKRARKAPTREVRKARTREDLLDAAERLFSEAGFHATSVDAVADEAGYTKGAVYSNFVSKEDLFFAVYERRVEAGVREMERIIEELGDVVALERIGADTATRRHRDDGWLAVFLEFWAHVVRHPELRARFAEIHVRSLQPVADALERLVTTNDRDHGAMSALAITAAMNSMQIGLGLERLTQPQLIDDELPAALIRLVRDELAGGAPRRKRGGR